MSSDIPPHATTGIGSLPYREAVLALNRAFAVDIPYFPTLPRLDLREGMVAQALEGFPGAFWKSGGELRFEFAAWRRGRRALADRLLNAFHRNRYRDFSPAGTSSLWELFVERASRHSGAWVKAQWLGPCTAVRALGLEQAPQEEAMELVAQVSEWVFARALAICGELQRNGKQVLFFWDEPGLSGPRQPLLALAAEQLRERSVELKNYGAKVGIHSCGAWDFADTLRWPLDYVSFDLALSGEGLLTQAEALRGFRQGGGRLCLGIVPTSPPSGWDPGPVCGTWRERFSAAMGEDEGRVLLEEAILSPACGLGTKTPEETEKVFALLAKVKELL